MINESITFDKLPQAVSYLTEQVIELKQMVSALQPTSSANNHILVEIDEAAIIIMKSKPTIYRLVNQGIPKTIIVFMANQIKFIVTPVSNIW